MMEGIRRGRHKFNWPSTLQFNLKTGSYPVILHLDAVVDGPPFHPDEFDPNGKYDYPPRRTLAVRIELVVPDYVGPRVVAVNLIADWGSWYLWPRPGTSRPAVAKFRRTVFAGQPAVLLLAFEPPVLIGSTP
jgi:hypothetical protein